MKQITFTILFITIFSALNSVFAQKIFISQNQQTQFLGPSFSGVQNDQRFSLYHRDCFDFPGQISTTALVYNGYFSGLKSGIGGYILQNNINNSGLMNTGFAINYNYNIKITEKWNLRPGIGFRYEQSKINFRNLVFGDQLNAQGENANVSIENPPNESSSYFEAAASLLIYTDIFWAGVTVDNILRHEPSFYDIKEKSKALIIATAGYKLKFGEVHFMKFGTNFYIKNEPYRYEANIQYSNYGFMVGVGMRNTISGEDTFNAIMGMTGYTFKSGFGISYCYDHALSNFINFHEISLAYVFGKKKKTDEQQ